MHSTRPSLFEALLIIGAFAVLAHGVVVLFLASHRRDWRGRGQLFFWSWQTWDASNYTEEGKRWYRWLPITLGVALASAVLALLVLVLGG